MILESPLKATLPTDTLSASSTNNNPSKNSLTIPCEKQHDHNNHQEQQHIESASPSTSLPTIYPTNITPNVQKNPLSVSQPGSGSNAESGPHNPSNTDRWLSKCVVLPSKLSNKIVRSLESYFYRLGYITGRYPFVFIAIGLLLTCITAGVHLRVKANIEREWIPKSLMHLNDQAYWVKTWEHKQESMIEEFPIDETIIIVRDENILTEQSIKQLMDIHNTVWNLEVKQMNLVTYWNWGLLKMTSLLQIWNFNETYIRSLTTEDIVRDVNRYEKKHKNVKDMIAEVEKNDAGFIIEAKVTRLRWRFAYTNFAWKWEKRFSEIFHVNPTKFKELYFYTYYDFTGYGSGMDQDITYAITGYGIMSFYVLLSLGHCNCLEQKIGLTIAGMMCIAMGYGFTIGMGALVGVKTGKLNDILALMLLGIGIDDMFVILGTLRNLSADIRSRSVAEQMGHVMKHAGVSITITTLSDVVAFGIGAFSVFPGLNTFCIYNAIGILAIYFYQITFFASCISLDLRRIMANRNACCWVYKYNDYKPNNCSQLDVLQMLFEKFASCILSKHTIKILVLFITFCIGSINLWCTLQLEANDDWQRVMYPTTHVYYKFYTANEKYFPSLQVAIYCKKINIQKNEVKLSNMSQSIMHSPYINNSTVENWFTAFLQSPQWKNAHRTQDTYNSNELETFLKSEAGKPYKSYVERSRIKHCLTFVRYSSFCSKIPACNERSTLPSFINASQITNCTSQSVNFDLYYSLCTCRPLYYVTCACKPPSCAPSNITSFNVTCYTESSSICNYNQLDSKKVLAYNMQCYKEVIQILAFKIAVQKLKQYDLSHKIETIEELQSRISPYFSHEECFAHASKYLQWSINSIIEKELIRNITLAFASVLIITLILITNVRTSLMVGSSVILTMLNITGTLYLWGINIETTSCVILTISVGLVVDYSVHIGHTFMTVAGEKNHRMIVTVKEIGPPVFHGGFSTFIAVLPLSISITYPFQTFFKIFFLVVLFGLFHGLVYLPVLLSLAGPTCYPTASEREITAPSLKKKKEENPKQGITNNGMVLEAEFEQKESSDKIETQIPQHQSMDNGNCLIKHISGNVASNDPKSTVQALRWTHIPA